MEKSDRLVLFFHSGRVCVAQVVCRQHGPGLCGASQSRPGELSATCGLSSSPVKWQDPLPLPHWGTWCSSESAQQFICLPLCRTSLYLLLCICRNMAGRKQCVRRGFRQRYRTSVDICYFPTGSWNKHFHKAWSPLVILIAGRLQAQSSQCHLQSEKSR